MQLAGVSTVRRVRRLLEALGGWPTCRTSGGQQQHLATHSSPTDSTEQPAKVASAELSYAEVAASIYAVAQGVGPFSLGDIAFGLRALARQHAEQDVQYEIKGREVHDRDVLLSLLDATDLAHGAYKRNPASLCAVSGLKLQCIRRFRPDNTSLRPAYYIALDHAQGAIVMGVRGTKTLQDLLLATGGRITPYSGGHVHWGMLQAAEQLMSEEAPTLSRLSRLHPGYRILLVGHSLGAGVSALMCHLLHTRAELRRALHQVPSVSCMGIAPPCVVSAPLSDALRPHVVSVVLGADAVPRFSLVNVNRLQREVMETEWFDELKSSVLEHEYVQGISKQLASASSSLGSSAAAGYVQKLSAELLSNSHVQQVAAAVNNMMDSIQKGNQEKQQERQQFAQPKRPNACDQQQQQQQQEQQQQQWTRQQAVVSHELPLQRQQQEEVEQEEQHEERWRQWLAQRQQQREADEQERAMQVDVVQRWVANLTSQLPTMVQLHLSDTDVRQAAQSAVRHLAHSLESVRQHLPALGPPQAKDARATLGQTVRRPQQVPLPEPAEAEHAGGEEQSTGHVAQLYCPGRLFYLKRLEQHPPSSEAGSPAKHVLIEAEPDQRFERLVLHPSMLEDHHTRSYRAALVELLKKADLL